ncbi:MAG: hypothetical protein ACLP9D_00305 [Candidatus Bathyarchaeia archaeon]
MGSNSFDPSIFLKNGRDSPAILNQFEKAGYMKIVNGNATWTSKGETIRTMLSSNLE